MISVLPPDGTVWAAQPHILLQCTLEHTRGPSPPAATAAVAAECGVGPVDCRTIARGHIREQLQGGLHALWAGAAAGAAGGFG